MKRYQIPRWFDWRNWSFATRLTLVMILLATITLSGVTFITTRTVRTILTNQIGENFEAQAVGFSDQVAGYFLEKVSQIQALAAIDLIKDELAERNAGYSGDPTEIQAEVQALGVSHSVVKVGVAPTWDEA